jgi:hypothetical protein
MTPQDPHDSDHFEHAERPTVNQPLGGGPRRSTLKPLLITIAVFAVLIALYLLGTVLLTDGGPSSA